YQCHSDHLYLPSFPTRRSSDLCTGVAQGFISVALEAGVDAYISGEISEPTTHTARECGIHYFAAGHHATERYGVQALGAALAERSEEHTSELQSRENLVCRLLL